LSADKIWVLPTADGGANKALGTDGSGTLIWREHDELSGFVANEHIDWTATASNLDTSGYVEAGNIRLTGSAINHDATVAADLTIENLDADKDIIFKVNDGGVSTEVLRLVGATSKAQFTGNILVDTIEEKTADTGVTIDGLLIKDGAISGIGALSSKIISFTRDMTAAGEDVAYTGVGFRPTALIAISAITASFPFCVGMADSAKATSTIQNYEADVMNRDTGLIRIATAGSVEQLAVVKSYDADGFTLTWTKSRAPTGTASITVICFK
jgi:hypothetical protein